MLLIKLFVIAILALVILNRGFREWLKTLFNGLKGAIGGLGAAVVAVMICITIIILLAPRNLTSAIRDFVPSINAEQARAGVVTNALDTSQDPSNWSSGPAKAAAEAETAKWEAEKAEQDAKKARLEAEANCVEFSDQCVRALPPEARVLAPVVHQAATEVVQFTGSLSGQRLGPVDYNKDGWVVRNINGLSLPAAILIAMVLAVALKKKGD